MAWMCIAAAAFGNFDGSQLQQQQQQTMVGNIRNHWSRKNGKSNANNNPKRIWPRLIWPFSPKVLLSLSEEDQEREKHQTKVSNAQMDGGIFV